MTSPRWPAAAVIQTDRLVLEPLRLDHAEEVGAALRDERLVGTVQATLHSELGRTTAEIAWVVAMPYQGQGYATESSAAMSEWLLRHGVDVLLAHVHPEHQASIGVARRLGMAPTTVMVDGETRWTSESVDWHQDRGDNPG